MDIIAVDWGKDTVKRAAFIANTNSRIVSKLHFDGSLLDLLKQHESSSQSVLIGIDAAIGFPYNAWQLLPDNLRTSSAHFIDFLLGKNRPERFFEKVAQVEDWLPTMPFISPPPGKWSRSAFELASNDGLRRPLDKKLGGNPMFVASGIPGSVGSGTLALWQELISLKNRTSFSIWPFDGSFDFLIKRPKPVIAEIYPKACYGIALSENLPAGLTAIAKTKDIPRAQATDYLLTRNWLKKTGIVINDMELAYDNEDDFDAMISAVALLRLHLENASFETLFPENQLFEGGVLGSTNLTDNPADTPMLPKIEQKISKSTPSKVSRLKGSTSSDKPSSISLTTETRTYSCPIPGCNHLFKNSRGGWDAHIASLKRHPDWHPDITDEHERKKRFKATFPEWFKN